MRITTSTARCLHCGAGDQGCRCTGAAPATWKATAGLAIALHVLVSATLMLSMADVFVPGWFVVLGSVAYVAARRAARPPGAALPGSLSRCVLPEHGVD